MAGAGALVRTARWRQALAAQPWQTGTLRIAGPAIIAFEPEGYDELDPDARSVHLRLLSTAVWRTRAVQGLDGALVQAAPVGRDQWVLTADGLGTLYGARGRAAGRRDTGGPMREDGRDVPMRSGADMAKRKAKNVHLVVADLGRVRRRRPAADRAVGLGGRAAVAVRRGPQLPAPG